MGANSPFVRRFDEKTVFEFAQQQAPKKLIGLYLGHDGVEQTFITIIVYDGTKKQVAHRTINLSLNPKVALVDITKTLPALLLATGIAIKPVTSIAEGKNAYCDKEIWNFTDLAFAANATEQACHALAIATLLPSHQSDPLLSPAKQAWLARAYVVANERLASSETGVVIRDIAWSQLGLETASNSLLSYVTSSDPVIAPLAKLLTIKERISNSPVRSKQDALDKEVQAIGQDFPAFARSVFTERAQFDEPFSQVNYCDVELASPVAISSSKCTEGVRNFGKNQPLSSTAKTILLQDWKIAASYKDLEFYGFTLGRSEGFYRVINNTPDEILSHPFVQRVLYQFERSIKSRKGFDDQLERTRTLIKNFVQSTINFQTYDSWYQRYSLTDHLWADNFNIINDPQIRPWTTAEQRLIAVMKFDRFSVAPSNFEGRRKKGDPAFFLATTTGDLQAGRMIAMMPQIPNALGQLPPTQAIQPVKTLSFHHLDIFDEHSVADIQAQLDKQPNNLELRTNLAIAQLKDGASVSAAMSLIDERLPSQRIDKQIAESHAWAIPAYAFYYAGEIEAAKKYYQKVCAIGTGSGSDLLAQVRLPMIAGNINDTVKASKARMARYDNEFA